MKKFFEITTDLFLFSFLLIIMIIPLLVSLNLDPKLYSIKPSTHSSIAGVSHEASERLFNFDLEQEGYPSKEEKLYTEKLKNRYLVTYKYDPSSGSPDNIKLGELRNNENQVIKFLANTYLDKHELKGIKVAMVINDEELLLFDGERFIEQSFTIPPSSRASIYIGVQKHSMLFYSTEISTEIRGVSFVKNAKL